jgi:hypothetical protein
VIEEIRRLMLKSTEETVNNREKLIRGEPRSSRTTTTTTKEEEQMDNSKFRFGILEDLNLSSRGAMRRSS